MIKKILIIIFVITCAIQFIGCGGLIGNKSVPPLEGYSKILIAPFNIKNPTDVKYDELPTMISYSAGTKLDLRFTEKKWFFDQSREVKPVSDKMKELSISKQDVFENADAAVKLAQAFEADIVIVGLMNEPKFTIERSGKIEYDMKDVSGTGAARYYAVYQTATLRTKVKVIEMSSGKVIWDGDVVGYKKYKTRYRTGETEKSQREDTMAADVRKDFVDAFVAKLYPEQVAK